MKDEELFYIKDKQLKDSSVKADYIVSLNEKCGSYIKNGANCGEDCIQYLNRKPTTKTGNIYYRIIELERNWHNDIKCKPQNGHS